MLNRRHVLKWAAAGGLALGLRPLQRQRVAAAAGSPARPRFYLQIIPSGGMDPIYGADPKTTREVEKGVDVPYAASKIVHTKQTRLAPGFAALAPHIDRIAIINGVRQNSANHHSGLVHTTCLRKTAEPGTPTLLDILGSRRDHGATASVSMGLAYNTAFSPKFLGEPSNARFGDAAGSPGLMDQLDTLDPDDMRAAARALRREAASIKPTQPAHAGTVVNLDESAAFLEGWAKAPKFKDAAWKLSMEDNYHAGRDVQRALWMFEHGLTRCATVSFGNYDSHFENASRQGQRVPYLASVVAALIDELDRRIVDGKPMSEQVAVMVGSEIGRFPRLNAAGGKDHLPQAPWLLVGPWFQTGRTYIETDKTMISQAVSLQTGKPQKGGHFVWLDDLGTTMLALDGANPEVYGYAGERLAFLTK